MIQTKVKKLTALVLVLSLFGCAGADIPNAKRTSGRDPEVAEIPSADETVRGADDPAIMTLDLGTALHEHRLSEGEDLPGSIIIPTTNLSAVPITAALQAVLSGTDVSLSWNTGQLGNRLVTVMNLSGPLPKVVERICSAAKVFCAYRNGTLELQEKETFVVSLPPIAKSTGSTSSTSASSANSMVEALNQLTGGSKIQVDDQGGNLIYTTDVEGQGRVKKYLEQLRNGRPLVVMQLYIWEVTLNKENSQGINWTTFKLGRIGPEEALTNLSSLSRLTAVAGTAGAVSLGAVTSGRININALAGFLSTQGRLQTISNPQVTFVSGSSAELKVGGTQRYISQVGQLVSATNVSGTTNPNSTSGVGSNTVNTDSIDTGLTVNVAGSYENGVVFANLDLTLINLVSLNPTASGGGTINLPQTTDEKMSTVIRVRPGDNLVLAGLVTSSDNSARQGIPLPGDARLPMYGDETLQNRELVIVVKPSVVLFSDKQQIADKKKKETSKPLPDAVFIDKDGPQALAVPPSEKDAKAAPVPTPVADIPAQPDIPFRTSDIALAPSDDAAVVDRRLMQRGFSHAFDDMRQPSSSVAGGGQP
ncbi:MAG: hypothetical protein WAO98_09550 [Alphaproteobacteria bacterium]